MDFFTDENLDFWIKNDLNVLLIGRHGVGKTQKTLKAFERNNCSFKYFSCSTIDPWAHIIGIPDKAQMPDGRNYMEHLQPKYTLDGVNVIFLDECNRANKDVQNALMELIQFKSINGNPVPGLKAVWAAMNPHDDEQASYDVEPLDPAQLDRFKIKCHIPYKMDRNYFSDKYGKDVAVTAMKWWSGLTTDHQIQVSPRKMDDVLDYSLKLGGNPCHVIPDTKIAVGILMDRLTNGYVLDKIYSGVMDTSTTVAQRDEFINSDSGFLSEIVKVFKAKGTAQSELSLNEKDFIKFKMALLRHSNSEQLTSIVSSSFNATAYKFLKERPTGDREADQLRGLLDKITDTKVPKVSKFCSLVRNTLSQYDRETAEREVGDWEQSVGLNLTNANLGTTPGRLTFLGEIASIGTWDSSDESIPPRVQTALFAICNRVISSCNYKTIESNRFMFKILVDVLAKSSWFKDVSDKTIAKYDEIIQII